MHPGRNRTSTSTPRTSDAQTALAWLIPPAFALGAGWLASLNGYDYYLPVCLAAFVIGGFITFLRGRLRPAVRAFFLDPVLAVFALSAIALLIGVGFDLGPRGLAVLASWCVTTPWSAGDLLLAKLALLPTAHGLMIGVCLLHMLLAQSNQTRATVEGKPRWHWWRRCQRCGFVLLLLPAVVLLTDALVLTGVDQRATSEWLSAAMVLTMATLMAVCAVVIQRLLPFSPDR